jgi:hypothetical protein
VFALRRVFALESFRGWQRRQASKLFSGTSWEKATMGGLAGVRLD